MLKRIIVYISLMCICIALFCLSSYAQDPVSDRDIPVYFIDYEKGRLIISIASLLTLFGLIWKFAIEVHENKKHREDQDIHYPISDLKMLLNSNQSRDLEIFRTKSECIDMHNASLQQMNKIAEKMEKSVETLTRLEEKIKYILQ